MNKPRPPELISILQLANMLKICDSTIHRHFGKGKIPRPMVSFGNSRYYLPSQVKEIKAYWKAYFPKFLASRISKYTKKDLRDMKRLINDGWTQKQVGQKYGCNQASVSALLRGVQGPGRLKSNG